MEKIQYPECLTTKDLNLFLVQVNTMINKIYLDCLNVSDSILSAQIMIDKASSCIEKGEKNEL